MGQKPLLQAFLYHLIFLRKMDFGLKSNISLEYILGYIPQKFSIYV